MARARRKGNGPLLLGIVAIAAVAVAGWYLLPRRMPTFVAPTPAVPARVGAPAAAGRIVTLGGVLRATKPARDAQLGVSADAVVLLREVRMLQWRESCSANGCDYALDWAARPIDSNGFRDAGAHRNPTHWPFSSARFVAGELRLGDVVVDPALAANGVEPVAYPVKAAQLPPNLAASLREQGGMLYSSADPAHGAVGDLRVSYRIVPGGERRLSGVQDGNRLRPAPAH